MTQPTTPTCGAAVANTVYPLPYVTTCDDMVALAGRGVDGALTMDSSAYRVISHPYAAEDAYFEKPRRRQAVCILEESLVSSMEYCQICSSTAVPRKGTSQEIETAATRARLVASGTGWIW